MTGANKTEIPDSYMTFDNTTLTAPQSHYYTLHSINSLLVELDW